MEPSKKSLKSYFCGSIKQQQNLQEEECEEKQALLLHQSDHQAVQPSDSQAPIRELVVEISGDENGLSKEMETNHPKGNYAGSSNRPKVSFAEVLDEAIARTNKDLPGGEKHRGSTSAFSSRNSWRSLVNRTKSRLLDHQNEVTSGEDSDHEDDDIEDVPEDFKKTKFSALTMLGWVSLVLVAVVLASSLFVPAIKKQSFWDIPIWKWEVTVMAIISGHLVSGWGIKLAVIIIEHNFLLRKRILYFVYGLRKAVRNCLWLGFVLLIWNCIFYDKEEAKSEILPYLTKILVCFLVGTFVWFLKTLLVKVLALNFHVNTFFERIQEALFNQYVIETLTGPPLFEEQGTELEGDRYKIEEDMIRARLRKSHTVGTRSRFSSTMSEKKYDEIKIGDLHKLNKKNISAWIMRRMIDIASHGSLSTLDEQILNADIEDETKIRNEFQANEAAKKIFSNVASPGCESIFLDDLTRFMDKEEALMTMHHFGPACEKEGISKTALRNWVVAAFTERKALALSLNDTKTAVDELHVMLNIVVAIIIIIIWLIIFGVPITHFLVFISSQLVLMAFVFGNTCKTVFEAIIFLFVMHPYDVGDTCEVDGMEVQVEEMNILTTVFLKADNQKIIYPNSVLATKPIGNFHRSPDMRELIECCVHISTPMEKIATVKERIKKYIEDNKEHWHSEASVFIKDVEDMNKIKICVLVTQRMNFQDMGKRWTRRSLLVEEMIKVFKELEIEYRMLPLDVNVRNLPPPLSTRLPSNWTTCAN